MSGGGSSALPPPLCRSAGLSSDNPFEQTHLRPALANALGLGPIPLPFVSRLDFEGWRLGMSLPQRRVERERGSLSWIALFLLRSHKSSDAPNTEVIPLWEDRASSKACPVLHRLLTLERQVFSCSLCCVLSGCSNQPT